MTTITDTTIYLGDNGRALCGNHLGSTAKATGHDLSGQRLHAIAPHEAKLALDEYGYVPACEMCGRTASLLHA